jgi:hypothetical protein
VLERANIDKALEENRFQGKYGNESDMSELGKMMGADLVCIITIVTYNSQMTIFCKLVNVNNAEQVDQGEGKATYTSEIICAAREAALFFESNPQALNRTITAERKAIKKERVPTVPIVVSETKRSATAATQKQPARQTEQQQPVAQQTTKQQPVKQQPVTTARQYTETQSSSQTRYDQLEKDLARYTASHNRKMKTKRILGWTGVALIAGGVAIASADDYETATAASFMLTTGIPLAITGICMRSYRRNIRNITKEMNQLRPTLSIQPEIKPVSPMQTGFQGRDLAFGARLTLNF